MHFNTLNKIENHVDTDTNKYINKQVKTFMQSRYLDSFKVAPHKMLTVVGPCTTPAERGQGVEEGEIRCIWPLSVKNLEYNF